MFNRDVNMLHRAMLRATSGEIGYRLRPSVAFVDNSRDDVDKYEVDGSQGKGS